MSLSMEAGGPKTRTARPRAAAKTRKAKQTAPRGNPQDAAQSSSELSEIEILAQLFIAHLALGEHKFAALRQEFAEWCAELEIEPPSAPRLAVWLDAEGMKKHRAGHAKITVYRKIAARPKMRLVA